MEDLLPSTKKTIDLIWRICCLQAENLKSFDIFPLNLIKNGTLHVIMGLNPLATLLGPSWSPLGANFPPFGGPLGGAFGGHFSLIFGFLRKKPSK